MLYICPKEKKTHFSCGYGFNTLIKERKEGGRGGRREGRKKRKRARDRQRNHRVTRKEKLSPGHGAELLRLEPDGKKG